MTIFKKFHKCPCCFYTWEDHEDTGRNILCEYCSTHPNMSVEDKIERYLDIMHSTDLCDLRGILLMMWKIVKEKQ